MPRDYGSGAFFTTRFGGIPRLSMRTAPGKSNAARPPCVRGSSSPDQTDLSRLNRTQQVEVPANPASGIRWKPACQLPLPGADMSYRFSAQLSCSLNWRLALAAAVLVLVLPVLFLTPAMARTPYEMSDGSEGDPGDGVLDPRAQEVVNVYSIQSDSGHYDGGRGYLVIQMPFHLAAPGHGAPQFLFVRRSRPGPWIMPGAYSWAFPMPARGWHYAR